MYKNLASVDSRASALSERNEKENRTQGVMLVPIVKVIIWEVQWHR